jgi:hypothetical protein
MRKLSPAQYSKTRNVLLTKARPLEKAMFLFEFEQGSAADVFLAQLYLDIERG